MKNYGLILKPKDPADYEQKLGASKIHEVPHRPDGNWVKDLPEGEIQQRSGFESFSCVSFGSLNAIELLEWVKYKTRTNYADRFLSVMAKTTDRGNDPKKVADTFRHAGAVIEWEWPFTNEIDSFDKFHAPIPLSVQNKGKDWLNSYEISYEWVETTAEELKKALQYSPLGIAVEAWQQDENGFYYGGENPNHWTLLVGFTDNGEWIVYDSYPETSGSYLKNLRPDYKFAMAMSYSLKKKSQEEKNESIWSKIINWLRVLFGIH